MAAQVLMRSGLFRHPEQLIGPSCQNLSWRTLQKRFFKASGGGEQDCVITSPPSRALMKAQLSLEQDLTVSVRPSLNKRVIDASYVRQNPPRSCRQTSCELWILDFCILTFHSSAAFCSILCWFSNLKQLSAQVFQQENMPWLVFFTPSRCSSLKCHELK